MEIIYTPRAVKDLNHWKASGNKAIQKKILQLLTDIKKHPFEGLGKPEALKYNLTGKWSRRINIEHRIIYNASDDEIIIYSLRGHY